MKKYFITVTSIIIIIFTIIKFTPIIRDKTSVYNKEISYVSMVDNKNFYVYKYGKWQKEFIKGVNIGAAKPGTFPGELAITKEDYLRWFKYIGEMNANTIRVYTVLKPEFYDALYEYNRTSIKPIYLMHGVWVNEEDIANLKDAFNPKIYDRFVKDIKNTIDIIHGNASIPKEKGHGYGEYTKDVSPYISGWILGIEWDPELVINTNKKNSNEKEFMGKYLYTENASPFEVWLAKIGDEAIKYESDKYAMQRPLSFTNWVTTDVLNHPNEPLSKEDEVSVNTEHIKKRDSFKPGLFASYHIYPYYPDFMNYQKEYANFKDADGKINTYRAYLKDLIKEHTVPVLVAEFGIPAARGIAHKNIHMGLNQGNVDETAQGEMDKYMLSNIYDEGYCGGLVFTWQDEWFKRTWNTMDFDIPDRRAFWSNPQTNEQEFGVLAFDPGEKESVCYVDGNIDEWKEDTPLISSENIKVFAKYDEKYLYLMAKVKNYDFAKDKIYIPIDTIRNQGNVKYNELNDKFDFDADFLIVIDGKENSKILVDAYYDSFYYMYSNLKMLPKNVSFESKNSGIFNSINLCLNRELFLPEDKITLPLEKIETGKLVYGIANPKSKEYNSLADYNINGENIEIKIPWLLLNVMDPSSKMIMGDLYENGMKPIKSSGFNLQAILYKNNKISDKTNANKFDWKEWEVPKYHERLKPSYYILQKAFKEIGETK